MEEPENEIVLMHLKKEARISTIIDQGNIQEAYNKWITK